jgi:hypothetical protein
MASTPNKLYLSAFHQHANANTILAIHIHRITLCLQAITPSQVLPVFRAFILALDGSCVIGQAVDLQSS